MPADSLHGPRDEGTPDTPRIQMPPARARRDPAERAVALLEVLLCSDYPTQLALGATLIWAGIKPNGTDGGLSLSYVAAVSFLDTAVLMGLIVLCLRVHGEQPRQVLFGTRPLKTEFILGGKLIMLAFIVALAVLGVILQFAPWLHTVEHNPLQDLMRSPGQAVLFALVVMVAGGIREEIQRAFLLHRFEEWLGGRTVGLVVTSVAFGAGHLTQGADASIAIAALGAIWGITYLRRRSAVASIVSHSGFNLLQLVQFLTLGR